MTREEKINKTVNSIKQVTFGRVDAEWIDAFKEGMRVALEAEEIEQSLKTCDNCKYYSFYAECKKIDDWDCMNDEPCRWTPPNNFGCNKYEAIK